MLVLVQVVAVEALQLDGREVARHVHAEQAAARVLDQDLADQERLGARHLARVPVLNVVGFVEDVLVEGDVQGMLGQRLWR